MEDFSQNQNSPENKEIKERVITPETIQRVFNLYVSQPGRERCAFDAVSNGHTQDEKYIQLAIDYLINGEYYPTKYNFNKHPAAELARKFGLSEDAVEVIIKRAEEKSEFYAQAHSEIEKHDNELNIQRETILKQGLDQGFNLTVESAQRAEKEGNFYLAFEIYFNLTDDEEEKLLGHKYYGNKRALLIWFRREKKEAILSLLRKYEDHHFNFRDPRTPYGSRGHANHEGLATYMIMAAFDKIEEKLEISDPAISLIGYQYSDEIIQKIKEVIPEMLWTSHFKDDKEHNPHLYSKEEVDRFIDVLKAYCEKDKARKEWQQPY